MPEFRKERIGYWSDVYGFKMSTMSETVLREAQVDVVNPNTIATNCALLTVRTFEQYLNHCPHNCNAFFRS